MASQLENQIEINKVIAKRNELLKKQSNLLGQQISLATGLSKALQGGPNEEVLESINNMSEALSGASEEADKMSKASELMGNTLINSMLGAVSPIGKIKQKLILFKDTFPVVGAAATGFIDGLVSGMQFASATIQSAAGLLMSVSGAVISIGKSIIAIPFRVLEGLVGISNKLTGYMEAIARATEDVRKQFGELSSGSGQSVLKLAKDIGVSLNDIGLSGYRIFGSLDERINHVNKTAIEMGAVFDVVAKQFSGKTGEAILLFQKGLGLTGEMLGSIARKTRAFGKDITDELKDIANFSISFGKRFGIPSKSISRDIGTMIADVQNFGNLAPKELVKVSVQARRLGLDVKELLGVVSGFDTFEDAAIRSAKLGQAFGATVDAMRLMRAENPADRIDMLRNAFFAAGKSAEMLSRQELKLLAQTTNISEEAARAAFSQRNMGVSLSELEKQGKLGEKQQLNQQQVLLQLADSIERIIKTFGQFKKGFFQAFIDGFGRGLFMQENFQKSLWTLNRALAATARAGMKVGKVFIEAFPHLAKTLDKFSDFFKVAQDGNRKALSPFNTFLNNVVGSFKELFSNISSSSDALPKFFGSIQASIKDLFGTFQSGEFKNLGKSILSASGNIIAGIVKMMNNGLNIITSGIAELMSGKKVESLSKNAKIAKLFLDPIINVFKDGEAGDKLVKSLGGLFDLALQKIKPHAIEAGKHLALFIFSVGFVKAAAWAIGAAITNAIIGWATGGGLLSLAGAITPALGGIASTIAGIIFSPAALIAGAVAAIALSIKGIKDGIDKFGSQLAGEFENSISGKFGAAAAGIVNVLTLGLLSDNTLKDIAMWFGTLSDKVLKGIEDIAGRGVVSKITSYMGFALDFLYDFGDVVGRLLSLDFSGAWSSIKKLGDSFLDLTKSLFFDAIPAIAEFAFKGMIELPKKVFMEFPMWLGKKIFPYLKEGFFKFTAFFSKLPGEVLKGIVEIHKKIFSFFGISSDKSSMFIKLGKTLVNSLVSGFKSMSKNLVKGFHETVSGLGEVMAKAGEDSLQSLKDVFGIKSPSREAAKIGDQFARGFMISTSNIPDSVNNVAIDSLNSLKDTFNYSSNSINNPAIRVIEDIVKETSAIDKALEQAKDLSVNTKLKELASSLGVSGEEFTVKHRDMNINVTLNVTMDAGDVANAIIKTGRVTSRGGL